jgi:hypothetical protein
MRCNRFAALSGPARTAPAAGIEQVYFTATAYRQNAVIAPGPEVH